MKRILFIDDDELVLETFKIVLGSYNFDITTTSSSLKGLELALENDFDLIITDLRMPDLNGAELVEKVKSDKPEARIYILTSYTKDDIVKTVLDSGASGIMEKPFELSKIISILNSWD